MRCRIVTATTIEGLQEAIQNEFMDGKMTEITSVSISVYNGLYYCLLAYIGTAE